MQHRTHYMNTCPSCQTRLHGTAVTDTEVVAYEGRPITRRTFDRAASTVKSPDRGVTVYLTCTGCGRPVRGNPIKATLNPEKPCTARCWNAKRASCECECGGEHHGEGRK